MIKNADGSILDVQQQRQHHSDPTFPNANTSTTSHRSPPHHVSGQQLQLALPTSPHRNPPSLNGDDHYSERRLFMSPGSGSA
ncbi:hypothetical protein K435DRAFT_845752, partial [Dendrothele bispora CBS 962.96]